LSTSISSLNARNAPNVSYLIGTFLPGLLFLIFGLVLRREKATAAPTDASAHGLESADIGKDLKSNRFKATANLGVGVGIVMMVLGSGLAQQGPDLLLVGMAVSLGGWALLFWGCVNYMRWKGHSGWYGLFGYLLLPGLIILACFPNRRGRILQISGSDDFTKMELFSTEDRSSGYRFLLTLVPLGVLVVGLGGFLFSSHSSIASDEWKEVNPPGNRFQALMPGTPRLEEKTEETPGGKVEIHKFTVEPKGKKELFMIMALRFPEDVGKQLGGRQKLLELGRQDLLAASQGQLQNERQIVSGTLPGLELEVLPQKGAIIKARIYATENELYQISVHVPKIRLTSEDLQKFFDSFKLSAYPNAAPDQGGV
jgi:hypothetical protein